MLSVLVAGVHVPFILEISVYFFYLPIIKSFPKIHSEVQPYVKTAAHKQAVSLVSWQVELDFCSAGIVEII